MAIAELSGWLGNRVTPLCRTRSGYHGRKNAMRYALGLTLCLCTGLAGCATQSDCAVEPNDRFDGDGLLLLEVATAQDGQAHALFFPVCRVDTADLVGSLQRASGGISFFMRYSLIQDALHHRVVRLTSRDVRRPAGLGKLYLTSVHLAFRDGGSQSSNPRNKTYRYTLNTDQVQWEQPVRITTVPHLDALASL